MYQAIIIIHVLLGLGVVGLVLLQHGKGADAGAAFGSASSGSVFGAQGASSFLSRSTAILAALFFSTSLGLAVLSGQQGDGPTDLMDTPDAEEVFTDLPSVNDNAPIKAIPMKKGDVPSTSIVPEGVSNSVDKAKEGVNSVIDSVDNQAETAIENTKEGISNIGDVVKDGANTVVDSVENKAETVIDKTKTIGSEKLGDAVKNK